MVRRGTATVSGGSASPSGKGRGSSAPRPSRAAVLAISIAFLLCLAAYLVLFYSAEFVPGRQRYRPLGFVLVPDELISDWLGRPFGEVAVLDHLGPLTVAATVLGAAFLLGWTVLPRLLAGQRVNRAEFFALATGTGLSGLSLATLAIGLWGGLRQPLVFLLLGLVLLAVVVWLAWRRGIFERYRARGPTRGSASAEGSETRLVETRGKRWWQPRWWWAIVPFGLVLVGGALLPPFDFDVLEYHLQVPREWYQQGSVTFMPHNVYGNMPLGSEMLATLSMALESREHGMVVGRVGRQGGDGQLRAADGAVDLLCLLPLLLTYCRYGCLVAVRFHGVDRDGVDQRIE